MPIPLQQRRQPIVRAVLSDQSLSASVWPLVPAPRSLVNVDVRAGSRAPLQVNWQVAAAVVLFGLGSTVSSTHSRLHLADSGLSSDGPELAHPVLVAARVLLSVFRFAQPDKLQPVHFELGTQQSCSGYTTPDVFAKTSKSASVAVVPKHFMRGLLPFPSARTWYLQKIQQQCRVTQLMRGWSVFSLPPTLVSVACFTVRNISSRNWLALSMAPKVAWLATGERSSKVLRRRLACTSRWTRVNVTS